MRSDRLYLLDILDSIAEIQKRLPADRAVFDADPPLQSHILRHVQIIGEATFRISPATKNSHPQVPWRRISGMRHVIVHDYFRVDWNIVYTTARDDVPALKPLIESVLQVIPPDLFSPPSP
jgi:uncharacterized protein with HEPN domain